MNAGAGRIVLGTIVLLTAAAALVAVAVATRLFGAFTIVNEPYYGTLAARIRSDVRFRAALGAPIRIDDRGVWCTYIEDSGAMRQANCQVPVAGSRGTGAVHVQVVDRPGALDADLWLHVGKQTIASSS